MDSGKAVKRLSENTYFSLEYRDDGVFFSVSPSEDGLSKDDELNILNYIRRKEIKNVDSTAIFNAIYEKPGDEVKIADSQNEKFLDQDIEIRVINRGMEARATLLPGDGGKKLTSKKAIEALRRKGIVFGIDEAAIERMLNQEIYYKEVAIAYGKPPQRDGCRIEYHINFNHEVKPSILEDGTVDYKNLNMIQKRYKRANIGGSYSGYRRIPEEPSLVKPLQRDLEGSYRYQWVRTLLFLTISCL